MSDIKRIFFIILGVSAILVSADLGLKVGWYLFYVPSSLDEANKTIKSSECYSSFVGSVWKCEAAYEYIMKNKKS